MTQCVTFWKSHIENSHIPQITFIKSLPVIYSKSIRQADKKSDSIIGPAVAFLLFLNDSTSNLPVSLNHNEVDGPVGIAASRFQNLPDSSVKAVK